MQSFFHPGDPYKKAAKEAQKGWEQAQAFQKPFWQQGLDQYPILSEQEQRLLNPSSLLNEWSQQYEMSPYAQDQLKRNQSQGLEAASAMGLMGSSGALENINAGAGQIMNKDREAFLSDLMQKYMQGIGLGKDIYNTGANTASNLGSQAQQQGQTMAGLKYGQAAAPGQLFGNLAGMGANALMNIGTGGFNNIPQYLL